MDRSAREGQASESCSTPSSGGFRREGGAGLLPGAGTLGGLDQAGVAAFDGKKPPTQGSVGMEGLTDPGRWEIRRDDSD